jgi:hypothetical protein
MKEHSAHLPDSNIAHDPHGTSAPSPRPSPQGTHLIRRGRHMTRICLTLSVSFLLLAFPFTVLRLLILSGTLDPSSPIVQTAYQLCTLLVMTNHVLNFWIYCVCWKEFRDRVLGLVRCRRPETVTGGTEP